MNCLDISCKMKNSLRVIQYATSIAALSACALAFAAVEGTYALEATSRFGKETTLEIKVDEEGEYSARLDSGLDQPAYTEDVEVDGNEFDATFVVGNGKFEVEITYSGQVEDGKLTGTISTGSGAEVKIAGKLRKDDETDQNKESAESN